MGKKTGEMDINKARNLDTKYPKRVTKYLEEVHKKFEGRNLFKAMEELKSKAYTENIWTTKMEENTMLLINRQQISC